VTVADTTTGTDVMHASLSGFVFLAIAVPFVYYIVGGRSWGRTRWGRWWTIGPLLFIGLASAIAVLVGFVMFLFGWVVTTTD
jgi:hypothetical protein